MEINKSNLIFQDFVINQSIFGEILFKKNSKENKLINFPIDIKLYILNNKIRNNLFKIILIVSGNTGKESVPGYKFNVFGTGRFRINDIEKLEKAQLDNLIFYSAVPMVLNNIRGYITNMTSYGTFGKYMLPSIDLNDLIKKYQAQKKK